MKIKMLQGLDSLTFIISWGKSAFAVDFRPLECWGWYAHEWEFRTLFQWNYRRRLNIH